jgi:two-component system OmpR family sensor kinase
VSLAFAFKEARAFQDVMLRQIATLASVQDKASSSSRFKRDVRVAVYPMTDEARPAWLDDALEPGLHTIDGPKGRLRVYIGTNANGDRTAVAQPTEERDELAINSAVRTVLPLLLFLPILWWLIVRIVRRELAPVARLAHIIDSQPADRPAPLEIANLPSEILPFVHAINRLLARINDVVKLQRRFIADAAHELRSPLTALSLQAHNVGKAESLEQARERLLPLQDGIERARRLTEQLLDLAKTQADGGEQATVAVLPLARELLAEFMPLAQARAIDLGMDSDGELVLRAVPDILRRILRNALENALHYAPAGGTVSLRVYTDRGHGRIDVIDNGHGIPAAERERVFDAFYRMPGSPGQGSGIGLTIAREAAAQLGGRVSLHPGPDGVGTLFCYQQAC